MGEIKNRFTGKVIYACEGSSRGAVVRAVRGGANLRDADLTDANLRDANLRGAYLRDADLRGADLTGAYLRDADLRDAYLGGADLTGAYLRDADLTDANLRGAYLGGADLMGAYLRGADLRGVQGYRDSHEVFNESVRRLRADAINADGWAAIGQIMVHRLCWDSIKQRHAESIMPVFELLADKGFTEWRHHFKKLVPTKPESGAPDEQGRDGR